MLTQNIDARHTMIRSTLERFEALAGATKNKLYRIFNDHPKDAGETYLQHLLFTLKTSARFIYIAFAIAMHGIFPFLFATTASDQVLRIYEIVIKRVTTAKREAHEARLAAITGESHDE